MNKEKTNRKRILEIRKNIIAIQKAYIQLYEVLTQWEIKKLGDFKKNDDKD